MARRMKIRKDKPVNFTIISERFAEATPAVQ